ncbi:MAG TPA: RNA 3'-terminal phosphate cyclase [Candidatus Methanoperedenaceae archaeon]|nr:RNA 3'-terminal phosphate cyclase [Candidatus Methanoperedenaceae archaeon]
MLEIDGSYGEGGGQILRTSIALSTLTGTPVRIFNIRASRPKPGLAAQHRKAIETAALICKAEVAGLAVGSREITYIPGKPAGGSFSIDIGTAGSITLLLQCLMPAALNLDSPLELKIRGGTDVEWSPSIDYLRNVTLHALLRMGYRCDIELIARGYYPVGGGIVRVMIQPSVLEKVSFEAHATMKIRGISHSSGLPAHVAKRQVATAAGLLRDAGIEHEISEETAKYTSTGSGITLWCGAIGSCAYGRRGRPAEEVGRDAAESIIRELQSGAGVDVHLADQLIPYMALARGGSFTARELSMHTRTNIWVTEQFLDVKFGTGKKGGLVAVWV